MDAPNPYSINMWFLRTAVLLLSPVTNRPLLLVPRSEKSLNLAGYRRNQYICDPERNITPLKRENVTEKGIQQFSGQPWMSYEEPVKLRPLKKATGHRAVKGARMFLKPERVALTDSRCREKWRMKWHTTKVYRISRHMFCDLKKLQRTPKKFVSGNSCTAEGTVICINPLILQGKNLRRMRQYLTLTPQRLAFRPDALSFPLNDSAFF